MSKNLMNKVGECGQDNLIARLFPRALTVGVKIVAGAGKLERGTVLSRKPDGTCEVMDTGGLPISSRIRSTPLAGMPLPPWHTVAVISIPMRSLWPATMR